MNDIGPVLLTVFGLVMLWIVVYFGWRPYRIDNVRNELFGLRDELFIYAAEGHIPFSDPSYQILRERLNALIRYAHIITLSRAMIFHLASLSAPNSYASMVKLPESAPAKVKELDNRLTIILAGQVITGSPLLFAVILIYVPILLIIKRLRSGQESTRLRVAKELRVELIEEQAVLAQNCEREMAACPV